MPLISIGTSLEPDWNLIGTSPRYNREITKRILRKRRRKATHYITTEYHQRATAHKTSQSDKEYMKTFTTCAEKKAKQFLNLLQGYTKGIRITAILILLLMGVNNAWAYTAHFSLMGNPTPNGWTKDTDFMINTGTGTADEWYIYAYVSKNQYFALNNGSNQYGPTTADKEIKNGSGGGTGNYNTNAWKFVGSSGIIKICCAESNNREWYPYVWVEESAPTIKFKHPWNGSSSWSEQTATKQSDGTYTYDGQYGNKKAFNAGPSGKYKYNESQTTVEGSPSTGDMCRFIWNPVGYVQGGAETKASGTFKIVKLCSLTYNGNGNTGGTVPSATNNQLYNTSITLSSTTLTKNGYTHTGWNTKADGTGDHYDKGASYTLTAVSATLYAEWAENTYSVTISAGNGGTVSPSGSKTIGQVTKTTVTATPNANYEFVNWTATGGVVVANTTSASTTITATATGTLTANFRSTATNSLTVVAGANIKSVTGSTDPVTLGDTYAITATPETGYTFSTWTANPAANATFGSATTANTTVTVKNGSVTVTATATENMSTLTTSNQYDAGDPGYAAPYANASQIGIATTATVTATAAGNGYTFTGWTLTNCTRTDNGATNATSITVRSNGDSKAAEVVANYAEDLTSTYYVQGDNAGPFSEGWNANQNTMMKKHSGNANSNDVYWEIDVPQSKVTPNDNQWEFKIYNAAGSDDNEKWLGWGSGDAHYWLTKENNNLTLSTSGSNNIRFKPYLAGKYTFHLNYDDSSKPTLEVTWPVYNQLRISAANPADATNTGEFDMTGSGIYTVTRNLNANTTYTFKIVYDSEWYGASSGNITRTSSSKTLSTSSNDLTIQTDIAGDYTFTFNSSDKKLDITYPTAYKVTYTSTYTGGTVSATAENNTLHLPNTEITFTATPKTGYTFKGWQDGNGTQLSIANPYTHKMNKDITINAVFEENTYNIVIVADPAEAAETLTSSPQTVGVEPVAISTTAKFTYKFDNWEAPDGITITDANNPSTSITATKAGTVTAHFTKMQPTTVYLKPGDNWKQDNARFAIHYWHEGQPTGWVDMTEIGCNRDYFVGTIPAGYTEFMFVRMNPANPENKWNADIDWNQTGNLTIPTDGKNLFTLPTSGDNKWDGATTTWSTYTEPTHDITINAPESGTIKVTIGGVTTTVTSEAKTISNVALNAQMTVAFTPATGYELGKAIIQIGNNEKASAAGTYTVCGPTEITAYFVTEKDQVVYLRPTDAWLADNARFAAYAFNRYAGTEAAKWIELTTKDTDYTGAFSGTIPAGFSHVQFVRMPETGDFSFAIDLAQTLNYSIPTDGTNNRFILGSQITSGSDKDNYQGSWEQSNTPIWSIPGDWTGDKQWTAENATPLYGPNGNATLALQASITTEFKLYQFPYGTQERQWYGNSETLVRGNSADKEFTTGTDNCKLTTDIADDYVFSFNIRNKRLTVTYPELPVPNAITVASRRLYDNTELDWFEGNGTEANPYKLYNDETIRLTVSPLTEVAGLTAYYKMGDNEEQTSNVFDWEETTSEPTKTTIQAYYKNATGTSTETVSVETPYYIQISLPFYLMTEPSGEINIDRVVAGENILVQFRSDYAGTVGLYVGEDKLQDIEQTDSYDYTYDVPNDIQPCVLQFKAQSTEPLHSRIFEATTEVAIYKNVIIKVHDPEGWVKNAYMWRDYSDAVLTQWPGDPVLQNFGTWRVFSVKYPYYDRFIVNDGKAEGATQTIDYVLPADDTCYELLDPADNGSSDPADTGKYGLQVADCPKNLLVEDIKDTTIMEGEQIVVMPKIYVGLGYQVADIEASVHYDNNGSIKAMMSGTNVTVLGTAEGESNVTVTYILDNVRIEKTFKVTVTKRTKITIQVKVPKEGTTGAVGWTNHKGVYLRYWHTGDGTNLLMTYLKDVGDYDYYEADVPLDANGETNFHLFYEQIDDNNRWRQTINKTIVKEDGCYLVTQDGGNYYRGLEYDGVRCLTDQYQVRIAMGNGKAYTSNIVTATEDTLSFYAPGMNETGYKAGVVMLYQNDKMIATIEPSTFAVSNVYTATLNDALNGLDNVSTYSGNFYIRTYGTSHATIGFNNGKGWNSIKDLTAVEKDSVRFTKFTSREGEFYNHYWVQAMNTGTFDGKDVSACVANEYNDDLAGKLLQDKHTNEYGDIKVGTGKVINVRFGYDPRTNYFGRAILQGSEFDTYLNIHCDNAYRDKDCTPSKKFPYGTSNRDNKMYDISTWVYQRDIYVPIDNSHPSASLYLEATSPSTELTVTDHLLGYVTNEITGEATTTPIQKTIIGSGTTNGTYLIRVVYDFKTNRLIAAWLPQGTVDVKEDRTLNADVLFVRQENNDVPQIQLAENGKIKSLESMFFAMELLRGDEDSNKRRQEQYWFTLPFDCKVGSISGVPDYMQTWGIQRYRGDLRAQKGWYAETPTFWEWLDTEDVMHAGEGYLLVFDKKNAPFEEIEVDKMDDEGNIIDGQKETISMMRLYFPSMTSGFDMQQQSAEQLTRTYENHTCTLTLHDRYLQDSNWKVIGTTSYNNAGITGYTIDTNPEYEKLSDAPRFRYSYDYNWENGKFNYEYTAEVGETAIYNSFYGYMVQFAGTINWQPIMSETVPEGIAARRRVAEGERTSYTTRLELANANGEKQDQTFVALDEKATTTFDQNLDLNKVMNSHKANIYTLSEGIPFAGNTLPMEKATVPVGVRVATAGEYTFRMPDGTDGISVFLIDNQTGVQTNMLLDEYTVMLDAGTCENRFYLAVDPDRTATSVENIGEEAKGEEAKDQIKKFLIDGQLFIRTADGTFDAKGQRL